jgi:hypothetical protein
VDRGGRLVDRLEYYGIATTRCRQRLAGISGGDGDTHFTGQAGLVLKCHSWVISLISSSNTASSCCLSQYMRVPGEVTAAYKSHKPTPTNVASARKTTKVGSIESSWVTETLRASVSDQHKSESRASLSSEMPTYSASHLPLALAGATKSRHGSVSPGTRSSCPSPLSAPLQIASYPADSTFPRG